MKKTLILFNSKLFKILLLFMVAALLGKYAHATCTANFTFTVNASTKTATFTNTSSGTGLIYSWTFGDATGSGLANPSKTYASAGTYYVCLTLHSSIDSTCFSTKCDTVVIPAGTPCVSNWTYAKFTTPAGDSVLFNSSASTGSNLVRIWTVNGTPFSTSTNPFRFFTPGTYTVCLKVVNSLDTTCNNTRCSTIVVLPPPCVANWTYSRVSTSLGDTIKFNSAGSTGSNLTYNWTIGGVSFSTLANPLRLLAPGSYTVCLTVRNALDSTCINTKCSTIVVGPIPCTANWTYTKMKAGTGDSILFNSSGSTGANLVYTWTVGGVPFSSSANPFRFFSPGTYTVCLTVRNSLDSTCTNTKCSTIVVTGGPCVANWTYTRDSTAVGDTIRFNSSTSTGTSLTYRWTIGGVLFSTSANPVKFAFPGTYVVCLTVTSSLDSTCTHTRCSTIVVGKVPCVANWTYTRIAAVGGDSVSFNSGSSTGASLLYTWTVGGVPFSTQPNPKKYLAAPGTYSVCLTVRSALDSTCIHTRCSTITVTTIGCKANFTFTRITATGGDSISFNSGTSTGSNLLYTWTSAGVTFSTLANPKKFFAAPGTYNVCLRVQNALDSTCSHTQCYLIVVNGPCTANFTSIQDSSTRGKFYFTNTSTGSGLLYYWTFGDGTTSTAQHPVHQYAFSGTYTVCLTVTNSTDSTCHHTQCRQVYITNLCDATFGYSYDTINPARTIHLYPHYGVTGTTYLWTFGDGDSSTIQYPTHTYAAAGWKWICLIITNAADSCSATYCDSVYVPGSTGLQEAKAFDVTAVYPNPFTDKIQVELFAANHEEGTLVITDALGKIQYTSKLTVAKGRNNFEVSAGELAQGVYFIELQTQNQKVVKRILK